MLRQTPGEVELRIYLPGNKWETPTDKKFKFENATGADVPRVHVSRKEEGKTELTHQEFSGRSIRLNSNSVRRRTGSCRARSSSRCRTRARARSPARSRPMSAAFASSMASPTWARIPWTRSNTSRCAKFRKDDPDKPVRDVDLRDGHYIIPGDPAKAKTGYIEAVYQVGDGTPTVQRFQFIKDQNEWRVLRALGAGQIAEAHPHEPPTAESAPEKQMIYQTAARLGKRYLSKVSREGHLRRAEFTANHNDKNRLGVRGQLSPAARRRSR